LFQNDLERYVSVQQISFTVSNARFLAFIHQFVWTNREAILFPAAELLYLNNGNENSKKMKICQRRKTKNQRVEAATTVAQLHPQIFFLPVRFGFIGV